MKKRKKIKCNTYICKADCCGIIPIPILLFNEFKFLIKKKYTIENFGNYIIPITNDGNCVYLNEKYRCMIYENRPLICKMFGDPSFNDNDLLKCYYLNQISKEEYIKNLNQNIKKIRNFK